MEVKEYDRKNRSIIISIPIDELVVIAEALRLSTREEDELIDPVLAPLLTPEGIVGLAYYAGIAQDVLKRLPGEIDDAIDHFKKLED